MSTEYLDKNGLEQVWDKIKNKFAKTTSASSSGSIFSFEADEAGIPLASLKVDIEPKQSGSGDPSPSNIRPISGWTGMNVYRTGINVWDEEWELGNIDTSGNNTSANDRFRSKNYISVVPNTTYTIKTPSTLNLMFYDRNKTLIDYFSANRSFTTASNCYYVRFICVQTTYNHNISINYPDTDTDYHAYNGKIFHIAWQSAGTVYGGNLDVKTGVLTVDMVGVDLGTLSWTLVSNRYWRATVYNAKTIAGNNSPVNAISELYTVRSANTAHNNNYSIGIADVSASFQYIYCNDASTSNTPTGRFVFEIETPQTYKLTVPDITTLVGTNNIWADTGDVDGEYRNTENNSYIWEAVLNKVSKDENTDIGVPDVNLILEYSANETSGANQEYGLGGMCYIGNNQYVFYVRNNDSAGNRGKLVCIDGSTKKFLWRTNSILGYHGNTLIHANDGIYISAAENDSGSYIQSYTYFPLSGTVTDGVMSGEETPVPKSGLGGNIAYDRSTGTYYSSVGKHIIGDQRMGDIYKWSGIFGTKTDTINLVDANQGNSYVIDLITNGWYQGCCIENGVFYQVYWRDHSIIAAYDLKTGAYIKSWNIPNKSNCCKVMNEIQDITYNYDNDMFLFCSATYTARIGQVPVVNISEVGLYKNLHITIPSRLQALVATAAAVDNCFVAYIEMGANGFRTSGTDQQGNEYLTNSPLRDDCTPCCDRFDANGDIQYNRFRSIKDADYAYECCTPGGGKIKYVFTNTFDNSFTVSSPAFLKPCIITGASGKTMRLSGPFLVGCDNAYICGESGSNPIVITGGGGAGYPEKNTTNGRGSSSPLSLILVGNGNELALQNVTFKRNSAATYDSILYGVYVYENGHLTVGKNVTLDTSVYTDSECRVAMYEVMPNKLFIATSTTAAGTATKTADINGTTESAEFSLRTGIRVAVRFTAGNSATTPTLNVNGTGAKSIAYPTSATDVATGNGTTYNRWGPNETVIFTYNGTYWVREATSLTSYLAYSTARNADATAADAYEMAEDATTTLSSMLQLKTYTYTYSSLASGGALVIKGSDFPSPGITTPSGYTPVAALKVLTGNNNVVPRSWDASATGSTAAVCIRNVSTSAQSGTVTFTILYAKSGVVAS